MKHLLILPALLITLLLGTPASATAQLPYRPFLVEENAVLKGYEAYKKKYYATALRIWEPLAEQGYSPAQYWMGYMYRKGYGVIKDYKIALKWYQIAAEQGHSPSQYGLGVMHSKGLGVSQNNDRAYMWYSVSASLGNKDAIEERDLVEKEMNPTQIEKATKLAHDCVKKKFKGCGERKPWWQRWWRLTKELQ